jgi:hypothetical protein
MELKRISAQGVGKALELAERYRLLNEPEQASSICRDVLDVEPENQSARRMLLLALTDEFGKGHGVSLQEATTVASELASEYERNYYLGVAHERWGRSKLDEGAPPHVGGEWLRKALDFYARAESMRPGGDDAAILRWNTCVRMIQKSPELMAESAAHELHLGD